MVIVDSWTHLWSVAEFQTLFTPRQFKCNDIYCLFEQGGGRNKQNSRNSGGGGTSGTPLPASVRFSCSALVLCRPQQPPLGVGSALPDPCGWGGTGWGDAKVPHQLSNHSPHGRCAQRGCWENNSASCRDFRSPHPVYRCTFLQLKEKLLEMGVSLMSLGWGRLCYWKTSGSWLRKGWVGSDVTLHKGCGVFAEGGQVGPQGSELTQLLPVFPAVESSSPKTRAYRKWRFRERDEQGRENCVRVSETFLSPFIPPFSIPKEENLCLICSSWCFQVPVLSDSAGVGMLSSRWESFKGAWNTERNQSSLEKELLSYQGKKCPRWVYMIVPEAGKVSTAGPGFPWWCSS